MFYKALVISFWLVLLPFRIEAGEVEIFGNDKEVFMDDSFVKICTHFQVMMPSGRVYELVEDSICCEGYIQYPCAKWDHFLDWREVEEEPDPFRKVEIDSMPEKMSDLKPKPYHPVWINRHLPDTGSVDPPDTGEVIEVWEINPKAWWDGENDSCRLTEIHPGKLDIECRVRVRLTNCREVPGGVVKSGYEYDAGMTYDDWGNRLMKESKPFVCPDGTRKRYPAPMIIHDTNPQCRRVDCCEIITVCDTVRLKD